MSEEIKVVKKDLAEEVIKTASSAKIPALKTKKKVTISLDMEESNILQLDSDGYELIFSSKGKKFKTLEKDVVRALKLENRERYYSSLVTFKELQEDLPSANVKITPNFARASARLDVANKKPGKAYTWKRPDELQRVAFEGGNVCTDEDIVTFGNTSKDKRHIVGSAGHEELVLCEYPEDVYNEIYVKQPGQLSNQRRTGVEEGGVETLAAKGIAGEVYKGSKSDGKNWSSVEKEKE